MIQHCARMAQEHPSYDRVIDILAEEVAGLLPSGSPVAIAGGQRRDWLFSGLVGEKLGVPHISLYKEDGSQRGKVEALDLGMRIVNPKDLSHYTVVPVVDLITEGSSAYRVEDGNERGWVPMLRGRGATVKDLIGVVSRVQGGEKRLAEQGVAASSLVHIDSDFIQAYSADPERALAYMQNPEAWSAAYLREHGALEFVATFNPKGNSLPRARRFLDRFDDVLREAGHYTVLDGAVSDVYNVTLDEVMERGE